MLLILDDFVIDRMFQPIVNYMMRHPIDMSLSACCGATVFMIVSLFLSMDIVWDQPFLMAVVIAAMGSQCLCLYMQILFARVARPLIQPQVRNPFRQIITYKRRCVHLLGIAIMIAVSLGFSVVLPFPQIFFFMIALILWTIVQYLQVCEHPPVIRQATPSPRDDGGLAA